MHITYRIKLIRHLFSTSHKNLGLNLVVFVRPGNQTKFIDDINEASDRYLDQLDALLSDCARRLTEIEEEHWAKMISAQKHIESFLREIRKLPKKEIFRTLEEHLRTAHVTTSVADRQGSEEYRKLEKYLQEESFRILNGFRETGKGILNKYK
jgi:hypothetical protein